MITTLASANAEQPSVVEVAWDEDVEFSLWLLGWDEEAFIREEDSVSEVPFLRIRSRCPANLIMQYWEYVLEA
ncbi:hypothetical protein [Alloyangia pacifica]|uniref:Uncharacterized protein n=1 Tax=Alloyangia pacifica TaxID=311180 RepID=A0A1I6WJI3_9RHOB|nr:hypothetical protein [Alloyangia pacifica]SDI82668.1 hypothetical protein SAMN04488245_12725 [Alloyangia pacifica]SFT26066.1 hypothetical protein SAMN04488050_12426 [Alloyangia pacifica]